MDDRCGLAQEILAVFDFLRSLPQLCRAAKLAASAASWQCRLATAHTSPTAAPLPMTADAPAPASASLSTTLNKGAIILGALEQREGGERGAARRDEAIDAEARAQRQHEARRALARAAARIADAAAQRQRQRRERAACPRRRRGQLERVAHGHAPGPRRCRGGGGQQPRPTGAALLCGSG